MKRVLITGAAGRLGSVLRKELAGVYPILRLSDIAPQAAAGPGEEIDTTDLTDFDAVCRMMDGVDGVIHLGGVAAEKDWKAIQAGNIEGMYNVYEAARLAGTRRVVYASSNHAIGFYPRTQRIDNQVVTLPDSRYGVSKAVGESLGALYAHKYGLGVLCIRIGNFNARPLDNRGLSIWVSPRDLAQLCRIGLEHPAIHYDIVYGASGNTRTWWDNSHAESLGYRPQDNAEAFAAELGTPPDVKTKDDAIVEKYQGGIYCVKQ